jgi:ADP-heptose:LPS heptosyltransferase
MWAPNYTRGYEGRKARYRVASLCRGVGLDVSSEGEKIVPAALAIGPRSRGERDIDLDLTSGDGLGLFSDNQFDYVFGAHFLTRQQGTQGILDELWRVLRVGGHLIIYEPDPDLAPHAGTPECDPLQKVDLRGREVAEMFGSDAQVISVRTYNASNEYSWQLIVRKKWSVAKKVRSLINNIKKAGKKAIWGAKPPKAALVIRFGALGDTLWLTPVLRKLKEEGYHVTVNSTEYGAQVLKENPNIDEFILHDTSDDIPYEDLDAYWAELGQNYDRVINLTKSIEGDLVKVEGSEQFAWPHEKRHAECNVNFQDYTMALSGYPDAKGEIPEMYFSDMEEHLAKIWKENNKDKFTILWSLSGSAYHKTYPWAEYVAGELAARFKNLRIITVGDELCKIMEWDENKTTNKCGVLTVRQSFLLTKYADLVVGPDTGLMNAASCYDTPKVILMSANSTENLTKYWKNCTTLWSHDCECYPCHRLIYSNNCPKGTVAGIAPKCMENIQPEDVVIAIEKYYSQWRMKRSQDRNRERIIAVTIADSPETKRLAARVRTSFKKLHPSIPFMSYDPADEASYFGEVKTSAAACQAFAQRPRLLSKLLLDYDKVIYLDADTVVTGYLSDMIHQDYDVAGSLNLGNENGYLNAGVLAVTSKAFCDEWTDLMYRPTAGSSNQGIFNELCYCGRYDVIVLDESGPYYNERSRPFWGDMKVIHGNSLVPDFVINDRQVKVLHWAGGVSRMKDKLSAEEFKVDVREALDRLCDCKDFTSISGEAVTKW